MKKKLVGFLTLLAAALASTALAETINVDVGSYAGEWSIGGPYMTGDQVVTLAPGTHTIFVGLFGFQIQVASGGAVTVPNAISASGGAGMLTFATVTMTVDPGGKSLSAAPRSP